MKSLCKRPTDKYFLAALCVLAFLVALDHFPKVKAVHDMKHLHLKSLLIDGSFFPLSSESMSAVPGRDGKMCWQTEICDNCGHKLPLPRPW